MSGKGRMTALLLGVAIVASGVTLTIVGWPVLWCTGQAGAPTNQLTITEMQKVNTAFHIVASKYVTGIEREKMINGAVQGMISSLGDPHSFYMDKREAEQFSHSVAGYFTGIGVEVAAENGVLTVISPIKGSPAEKAGLKPKDVLLAVDGTNITGVNLKQAISKIRGAKGTKVNIMVKRVNQTEPLSLTIIRDEISMKTVSSKLLADKLGYIEIRQFSLHTAKHFKKELTELETKGIKGLIIDVRNNPGGALTTVQQIAELFVPKGKIIVQIADRNKKGEYYLSKGQAQGKSYPITMLMNKGSASASEILASALKQSAKVTLIGEETFGKGTVQETCVAKDGSIIKITIAKWLTPNGDWIHQTGVKPDITVQQPPFYNVVPISKTKVLTYDMNNHEVKNVQIMLAALGYRPGRTDGYFSKDTAASIRAFQKKYKLTENGNVDEKTARQLEQMIKQAMRDPKRDTQLCKAIAVLKKEIG